MIFISILASDLGIDEKEVLDLLEQRGISVHSAGGMRFVSQPDGEQFRRLVLNARLQPTQNYVTQVPQTFHHDETLTNAEWDRERNRR